MRLADARLLSFDCYGTLIDWEFGITETVSRLAAQHHVHPTQAQILSLFASHETKVQDANPTFTYRVILQETWRRMATSLGLPDSITRPDQCDTDARAFAASVPNWPAFADSHDALVALQTRCKLVILSNVDNLSFAGSNARLGITFDAVLTAQDIGSYKPDLHNFHVLIETAKAMGAGPDQHLHVAQSLFHDHVPAQTVGLQTVWINRYGAKRAAASSLGATPASTPVTPHWEFSSLQQFADAVLTDDADRN